MTREEIIKYIEFRASGINQAVNYDYKEFYKEILEMCKQEKQGKTDKETTIYILTNRKFQLTNSLRALYKKHPNLVEFGFHAKYKVVMQYGYDLAVKRLKKKL